MSKFKMKLKLTGLELEVEGTREDAPKIAASIGQQLSGFLQPTTLLGNSNGTSHKVIEAEIDGNGTGKKKKGGNRKSGGSGGTKTSEDVNFVHDPSKFGTPAQGWTVAQKAIWFIYIVGEQTDIKQQTAYGIMKNFNVMFRSAKTINSANVMRSLEKEKLKGANAPVGTDTTSGTAKYFLTQTGIAIAQKLAKGEAVAVD